MVPASHLPTPPPPAAAAPSEAAFEDREEVIGETETAFSKLSSEATRRKKAYGHAADDDEPTTDGGKDPHDSSSSSSSVTQVLLPASEQEEEDGSFPSLLFSKFTATQQDDDDDDEEMEATFDEEEPAENPPNQGRRKKAFSSKRAEEDEKEDDQHVGLTENDDDDDDDVQESSSKGHQQELPEETSQDTEGEDSESPKTLPQPKNQENESEENKADYSSDQSEPASGSSDETTTKPSQEQAAAASQEEEGKEEQLDEQALFESTDRLFVNADQDSVTVGDIVRSIEAEFGVSLSKPIKKLVRNRLKDLITGVVKLSNSENNKEKQEESESESEEELMEEESSDEEEEDGSEYEDEEEERQQKRKVDIPAAAKKKQKSKLKAARPVKAKKEGPSTRRSSTRRVPKTKKPSHVRVHAEMLRKKRMEELRVRNEELQLAQSKEDRKRAEMIAQKFETDTDELQRKRLEDRLDLLQKLDQTRSQVIAIDTTNANSNNDDGKTEKDAKSESSPSEENDHSQLKKDEEAAPSVASTEDSEEDDDDDSEEELELEILGAKDKFVPSFLSNRTTVVGFASIRPSNTQQQPIISDAANTTKSSSTALSILDLADQNRSTKNKIPSSPARNKFLSLHLPQKPSSSPGKSLNARHALRQALQSKQRKAGNMWLARELGYKTEGEHIRDCQLAEKQKRERVMKKEEERLRANERQLLRERLLLEGAEELPQEETEQDDPTTGEGEQHVEELDEEMEMAREIEKEKNDEEQNSEEDSSAITKQPQLANTATEASQQVESEGDSNSLSNSQSDNMLVDFNNDTASQEKDTNSSMEKKEGAGDSAEDDVESAGETSEAGMTKMDKSSVAANETAPTDNKEETDLPSETNSPERNEITDNKNEVSPENMSHSKVSEGDSSDNVGEEDGVDVEENEFGEEEKSEVSKKPRNAAWKALLQKEAEQLKKMKKIKGGSKLVDAEAEEEEEEEAVMGLEDFGFSLHKKKKDDDDEEGDKFDDDDLENIVDDVSDNEGDEEAGEEARKAMEMKEEKERHKEILRRMRNGYDGRRGGIAGGGVGARGLHRFDQLVAADNREDAKRLGLLNDDELDSEDEGEREMKDGDNDSGEIEDETALLDKMLKDRFLHRSSAEAEENFSDDESDGENATGNDHVGSNKDEDEKEQERLAKRFAKRARMQRLLEAYGEDEEFTQSRLIDEDESMKKELRKMKDVLGGKRQSSITSVNSSSLSAGSERQVLEASTIGSKILPTDTPAFGGSFLSNKGKLSLALKASRRSKQRTSFLGGSCKAGKETGTSIQKNVALGHVVFHSGESQLSKSNMGESQLSKNNMPIGRNQKSMHTNKRKRTNFNASTSLWSKVSANSFKKRR